MAHKSAMDAIMERLYEKEQTPKPRKRKPKPKVSKKIRRKVKAKEFGLAEMACPETRH